MKEYSFYAILLIVICSATSPKNSGDMQVEILNLKNNKGSIKLSLFNSESGYPDDAKKAFRQVKAEIKDEKALIVLKDIPYGKYAIAYIHDENNNDKMDFHFYGKPKEGYGASNNATGFMGPPDFEDAAFDFNEKNTKVSMNTKN